MNEELPLPESAFSGWDYGSVPAVQRDGYTADQMREYAALVRADEKEGCAKVCESYLSESPHSWGGTTMAAAIRARGNT